MNWTGIVKFAEPGKLVHESGATLRAENQTAETAEKVVIRQGSLEQSNVAVVQRISEITDVSRAFEALQKSVGVMMNVRRSCVPTSRVISSRAARRSRMLVSVERLCARPRCRSLIAAGAEAASSARMCASPCVRSNSRRSAR